MSARRCVACHAEGEATRTTCVLHAHQTESLAVQKAALLKVVKSAVRVAHREVRLASQRVGAAVVCVNIPTPRDTRVGCRCCAHHTLKLAHTHARQALSLPSSRLRDDDDDYDRSWPRVTQLRYMPCQVPTACCSTPVSQHRRRRATTYLDVNPRRVQTPPGSLSAAHPDLS